MVVLDTSVLIGHLRLQANQKPSSLLQLFDQLSNEELVVSVVSLAELYVGKNTLNQQKEQAMLTLLSLFRLVDVNYQIAKLAGQLIRDHRQPLSLSDALIAATAIFHQAKLYTFNLKHFRFIKGLEVVGD